MNIRERTEQIEKQTLSPYAMLVINTKGRERPLPLSDLRTEYQRDRDRILHSKSFRRLKHKTQVFITPEGDHYRTRLTHTLEVAQVARTICRALRLNEDLVEAMALGHDLGHTPFGHAGESVLNELCSFGFQHNEQSIRVAERLEHNGEGMNLTYEVRDGIRNHSGSAMAETLEGVVLKYADRIAYINHDIDDALRGGVISEDSIPRFAVEVLGNTHSKRIDTLISDMVFCSMDQPEIRMSDDVSQAMNELREFMFQSVYIGSKAKLEEQKAKNVIQKLFEYFMMHPDEMPEEYQVLIEEDSTERAVCDYIAGMSDRFAVYTFQNLFVPRSWDKI